MHKKNRILPVIVIAQFCCTSLWFASNAVMQDLVTTFNLTYGAAGQLTSAIQFGFIIGTLTFAVFTIADRFSPSKVFSISAVMGAFFNTMIVLEGNTFTSLLILRFFTGFFLAGIYPVGMKIAADHFKNGLGKSLGFLVGALVLGTAFPHLLKGILETTNWRAVLLTTSTITVIGSLLMLAYVPNGPYRVSAKGFDISGFSRVFGNQKFKAAALGYFGHMWELYTFWAFVPVMLSSYSDLHATVDFNIPLLSFFIIGIGSVGCVAGGYLSQLLGTKQTAFMALLLSCICCIISPLVFNVNSEIFFIGFLVFWGVVVIADSPLFSTLVAQNAQPEIKGTALTIVNCIGFSITIVSILIVTWMLEFTNSKLIYITLGIGPLLGLLALTKTLRYKKLKTMS